VGTRLIVIALYLLLVSCIFVSAEDQPAMVDVSVTHDIPYGVIEPELLPVAYSGGESFRYDISYTGGFKLGELYLEIKKSEKVDGGYIIHARVTTENGLLENIYPIEDLHVTQVSGPQRLPFHYEVWQKEGFNYEAHRVTKYEQEQGRVVYQLNDNPVEVFTISGTTQNEFSSFFASRIMPLVTDRPFIVPTFADEKRIEVVVMVKGEERLKKTILGTVKTKVVEPIMTFSGLYDKRGDTVIWYTDDHCRVPVLINSKILIGSLTAELVAYKNEACPEYDGAVLEKYQEEHSAL